LGTIQSAERQRCEEKWTASWGHYSGWPQKALAIDEGALGSKKESPKEVNVVCCYSADSWSDCGAVGFIDWLDRAIFLSPIPTQKQFGDAQSSS